MIYRIGTMRLGLVATAVWAMALCGCVGAPSGLDAGTDAGVAKLVLEWDASTTSNVTYSVYRATQTGGPYTLLISGLSATTYTDAEAAKGVTYFYVAKSVNAESVQSDDSNEASGAVTP